ncbi:MAG: hypothetical protein N2688_05550 [Burkholderiaceae bacterium]|nr:hypothetical protein [Burkholderiaceae bacterium]
MRADALRARAAAAQALDRMHADEEAARRCRIGKPAAARLHTKALPRGLTATQVAGRFAPVGPDRRLALRRAPGAAASTHSATGSLRSRAHA